MFAKTVQFVAFMLIAGSFWLVVADLPRAWRARRTDRGGFTLLLVMALVILILLWSGYIPAGV